MLCVIAPCEDHFEASQALQRGFDQGPRDLWRAEAQDSHFVPADSASDFESSSSEGSSTESPSGGSRCIDLKSSQASPSVGGSREGAHNISQGCASPRAPSPARSTISVSSTSSRHRPPPPQVSPRPVASLASRLLKPVTLSVPLAMSCSPISVASSVRSCPSF